MPFFLLVFFSSPSLLELRRRRAPVTFLSFLNFPSNSGSRFHGAYDHRTRRTTSDSMIDQALSVTYTMLFPMICNAELLRLMLLRLHTLVGVLG